MVHNLADGSRTDMWSDVNTKHSRGERASERLAGFGRERTLRESQKERQTKEWLENEAERARRHGIGQGGRTSAPPERMSRRERKAADKILKEGKQPRGKK